MNYENRGRMVAHIFYAELEKIARVIPRLLPSELKAGMKHVRNLSKQDATRMMGSRSFGERVKDKFSWLPGVSPSAPKAGGKAIKGQYKAERKATSTELESRRAQANQMIQHGNTAEQAEGRKWIDDFNKSIRKKTGGGGATSRSGSAPSTTQPLGTGTQQPGDLGPVNKAFRNIGIGTAAVGAGIIGKKVYDARQPQYEYYQ